MTRRDIQAHLEEIYGVEVSPTLISNVTDAVQGEVQAWDGCKEMMGLWTSPQEGAKYWLQVLTEMRNRGLQDVFISAWMV